MPGTRGLPGQGSNAVRRLQTTPSRAYESRALYPTKEGKTELTDIRELVRKARKANLMRTISVVYFVLCFIGPMGCPKGSH